MAFSDEVRKLQRVVRTHLRFSIGTASDNPDVAGSYEGWQFGKVGDNTGTVPIVGTVEKFGTFSRALINVDQTFEAPTCSPSFFDKESVWRKLAATPWKLLNRWIYYVVRILQDDGTYVESDIAWGQITTPEFPPSGKAAFTVEMMPGDYLGKATPRRLVTTDDWPNADPGAVGKAVPIIYGPMDNSVGAVQGFTGSLDGSGIAAPTGLTATRASGGNGNVGVTSYYAIAAIVGGVVGEICTAGPVTTNSGNRSVQLAWNAYTGASGIRVWRGNEDFGQMDRYRVSGNPYSEHDLAGGAVNLLDLYPGINTRAQLNPDPHWDLNYRQQQYYYISAIVGGETVMTGPVYIYLSPRQTGTISLSWTLMAGATGYKLRRQSQTYHFDYGWTREWSLGSTVNTFSDDLSDTSTVTLPDGAMKPPSGALEVIYVNTNPVGTAGQYTYLIAGHGCKQIRKVYVTKSKVMDTGGKSGSISRPAGVTLTLHGTHGTTKLRYSIAARNGTGETTDSNQVRTSEAPNTLNGTNYVELTWDDVEDATGYNVYRSGDDDDLRLLATTSTNSYNDKGEATPDGATHSPENNTTDDAYERGEETVPPAPVLQAVGTDYVTEVVEVNGNRYQIIRFNASQAGNPVTADVYGIEDAGTATGANDGGTLITDGIQQFKHFLLNWVFNSYRTGSWFTDTGYRTGLLHTASFDAASAVAAARISGGYLGAGALTEVTDIRQAIQDWIVSFDLDYYFWNGQFKVSLFDPAINRETLPQYSQADAIFRETFASVLTNERQANKLHWQGGPQYDGYFISGVAQDTVSQGRYSRVIDAPEPLTLMWTRDRVTGADVAAHRVALVSNPRLIVTWSAPLKAFNDELSVKIAVTHPDGISLDGTGWDQRACKITRSDIDFDKAVVYLEALDIEDIVDG